MYSSLLAWCRTPVEIRSTDGYEASGDKKPDTVKTVKCYVVEEVQTITDKVGNEYNSGLQMYMPATVVISEEDRISFEGKIYEIRKLMRYYDGTSGLVSIILCYL